LIITSQAMQLYQQAQHFKHNANWTRAKTKKTKRKEQTTSYA